MTLVIETGAGIADAEAYADVDACSAWAVKHWGHALTGSPADKEAAIRRAVAYLNGLSWYGHKTHGREQPLAWPRAWMVDAEGYAIPADEIPAEVIEAQHMLARAEFQEPGCLAPVFTAAKQKTLVEVKGIKWQASGAGASVSSSRAYVSDALDRLKGLIRPVGQASVVRA